MLDPKLLRSDLGGVATQLARRNFVLDVAGFATLEEQRKSIQVEADRLRAERNAGAKAVGQAKAKGQDVTALLVRGEALGGELQGVEKQLDVIQAELAALQLGLPNLLHESVAAGDSTSLPTSNCAAGVCRGTSTSFPRIMSPSVRSSAWISRLRAVSPARASWS